jgi:hypothetical protein
VRWLWLSASSAVVAGAAVAIVVTSTLGGCDGWFCGLGNDPSQLCPLSASDDYFMNVPVTVADFSSCTPVADPTFVVDGAQRYAKGPAPHWMLRLPQPGEDGASIVRTVAVSAPGFRSTTTQVGVIDQGNCCTSWEYPDTKLQMDRDTDGGTPDPAAVDAGLATCPF